MIRTSFTTAMTRNVHRLPRSLIASMFAVAVVSALIDVASWAGHWNLWTQVAILFVLDAIPISAVEYLGIMRILGATPTVRSYLKFACVSVILLLPAILGIAALFGAPFLGASSALLACGVGVMASIAIIAFLPAWPVAQAFSSSIVPPTKVFNSTRGFRWGLVGAVFLLSVFNRQDLVPAVDKATDLSHAFAYAAGQAGLNTMSMIFTAAVAATAFIFACGNDEDLRPPRSAFHGWDGALISEMPA
jgi:hypothetical protein